MRESAFDDADLVVCTTLTHQSRPNRSRADGSSFTTILLVTTKWRVLAGPFFAPNSFSYFGMVTDTASLVPLYENNNVYLVLDELVTGRVWRELSDGAANEQTVLKLIANGEFHRPLRVIMFNTAEGRSRDETVAMGFKLLQMSHNGHVLGEAARELVERTTGQVPTLLA